LAALLTTGHLAALLTTGHLVDGQAEKHEVARFTIKAIRRWAIDKGFPSEQ
jgi:6,7-dimethyl-8-ribityllumazine synthase